MLARQRALDGFQTATFQRGLSSRTTATRPAAHKKEKKRPASESVRIPRANESASPLARVPMWKLERSVPAQRTGPPPPGVRREHEDISRNGLVCHILYPQVSASLPSTRSLRQGGETRSILKSLLHNMLSGSTHRSRDAVSGGPPPNRSNVTCLVGSILSILPGFLSTSLLSRVFLPLR
jgi:hypothetical protein